MIRGVVLLSGEVLSSHRVEEKKRMKKREERERVWIRLSTRVYLIEYAMPFEVKSREEKQSVGQTQQESSLHQTKRQIKE